MRDKNIKKIITSKVALGDRMITYQSTLTPEQLPDSLWEWDLIMLLRLIKIDVFEIAYNEFILKIRKIEDKRKREPQNELSILFNFIKEIETELEEFDGLSYYCQTPIKQVLEENTSFIKTISLNLSIIEDLSKDNYWVIKILSTKVIPHLNKIYKSVIGNVGIIKFTLQIQAILADICASNYSHFKLSKLALKCVNIRYDVSKISELSEIIGQIPEINKIILQIARAYTYTNMYYLTIDEYNELARTHTIRERALNSLNLSLQNEKLNVSDAKSIFEEFTEYQVILIFDYFFKSCGIETRTNIDVSAMARFLHLITKKNFTNLQNSEIYLKLRKVPNFKSDKNLLKDLEKIKPLFENCGLKDCIEEINNEIGRCLNEIDKKNEI